MSYKFVLCAPSANGIIIRSLSTIARTKNVLNCGFNMARNQFSVTLHGPPANQLVKELDLSGKTCLITGANSGLGLEMTRCLSARGCSVLMACRNKYAAGQVARDVAACALPPLAAPAARFYELNLASLRSVTDCSDHILKNEKNVKWSVEDQLLPTEGLVSLPCDQYTSIKAYNISKLCCLLAMHNIAYRWSNTKKSVLSAHPGSFVKTRLCRNWWLYEALYTIMQPFTKTVSQAASTPLYCATSPDLNGLSGYYYKNLKRCEESELAKDFHLSFRMYDLYRELLTERLGALDAEKAEDRTVSPTPESKVPVHDTLTPEYSA